MSEQVKPNSSTKKVNNKSRRVQGPSSSGGNSNANNKNSNKTKNSAYIPWNRNVVSDGKTEHGEEDTTEENETCVICAEKCLIIGLTSCGHKTCHRCALRQKVLYDKDQCIICRSKYEDIIFTSKVRAVYADFSETKLHHNSKYNFQYDEETTDCKIMELLNFTCPMSDTSETFSNHKSYNLHLKKAHNRTICNLCAEFKFEFPSEMEVFTHDQLKTHNTKGDPKNGFFGHPVCPFCSGQRSYSDDELYKHMREHHERCHICYQIDPKNPQWFKDYNQVFEHFKTSHYCCTHRACLDAKFVVFKTEIDLQAHMVQEHGIGKNLNLLESFHHPDSRIATEQNNSRRFQSELSTFQPAFMQNENEEAYLRTQSLGNRHSQNTNSDSNNTNVKKLRFEERARHYLHYSSSKCERFTKINSDYSNNLISSKDLFERFKMLFSEPDHDVALLIYDFANLFPASSQKNKELLAIYEELKNEKDKTDLALKFPPLNGMATPSFKSSWTNSTGNRVATSKASLMNFPALPGAGLKAPAQKKAKSLKLGSSVSISSQKNRQNTPSFQDVYGTPIAKKQVVPPKSSPAPTTQMNNRSSPAVTVDKSKFPPLPAVSVKRAPLVNPLRSSSPGNFQAALKSAPTKTFDPFDVENLLKQLPNQKTGKKGKKQLLMHIGI